MAVGISELDQKTKLEEEIRKCKLRCWGHAEEIKTLEVMKDELFEKQNIIWRTFQDKRKLPPRSRETKVSLSNPSLVDGVSSSIKERMKYWDEDEEILREMREALKSLDEEKEELERRIKEHNSQFDEQMDLQFDLEVELDEINKRIEYWQAME